MSGQHCYTDTDIKEFVLFFEGMCVDLIPSKRVDPDDVLEVEITLALRASLFDAGYFETHLKVFEDLNRVHGLNWSITFWRSSDILRDECRECLKFFEERIGVAVYYDLN